MKNKKYVINKAYYYTMAKIGKRTIYIPSNPLKQEQKYFLNAIKWEYPLKLNTLNTARQHLYSKWILKMDIKDFYNSVPYEDILEVLRAVCLNHLKEPVWNYYLSLTTYENKLPTGAPTSAHIANACFKKVDKKILKECAKYSVVYTRYMDDLIFSCNSKATLKNIEHEVRNIVRSHQYRINEDKVKYLSTNKQQNILGLVINDGYVRISNEEKRKIRAMIYNYIKGVREGHTYFTEIDDPRIKGYLSYLKAVDKKYYEKMQRYLDKLWEN